MDAVQTFEKMRVDNLRRTVKEHKKRKPLILRKTNWNRVKINKMKWEI